MLVDSLLSTPVAVRDAMLLEQFGRLRVLAWRADGELTSFAPDSDSWLDEHDSHALNFASSTYISREWHSKGVRKGLLQHAQTRASECGFETIVGWIKTDNLSSIRLVTSLGWKFVGILPRRDDNQQEFAYYAYAVSDLRQLLIKDRECL